MLQVYETILSILTSPAGSLTYHLILVFSITWALQSAASLKNTEDPNVARRLILGLALLLLSRVLLFVIGVLSTSGSPLDPGLLPVLDRAVTAFGLVIIVWLWTFPETVRLADAATILLTLLVITLLALSFTWSSAQFSGQPFNSTPMNTLWEGFSLFFAGSGILFLLLRRPPAWEYGLGMLSICFAGHLVQLLWSSPQESIPGAVRLAQMAAYPFLLALPQRQYDLIRRGSSRRFLLSPGTSSLNTLNHWFDFKSLPNLENKLQALPAYVCQVFNVDFAALFIPGSNPGSQATLLRHDRRKQYSLEPASISEGQIPILWNALKRQRPLRLHASSSSADLDNICRQLDIENGNLLAVPVTSPARHLLAGLFLFSFDPSESWTNEDQNEAIKFSRGLGEILADSWTSKINPEFVESGTIDLDSSQEFDAETTSDDANKPDEFLTLIAALQSENKTLQNQLETLQAHGDPSQNELLEEELRNSLADLARLQKQLSDADQKLMQASNTSSRDDEHAEVIVSIAQELRQPMSSIIGYTDLLIGESVGILGALQRKFLERIKASTERMGALLDDLIQVTSIESNLIVKKPVEVDLNTVIDEAITHTSARMIEKNIALRVDIPNDLPRIQANQDALQQVVIHLLQNAGAASPADSEIILTVQNAQDELDEKGYILLQVTDSGGGIPIDDLHRVFSRLYRADNPLIQGVGDTGVGLSVAKNLVVALQGRIWVDTEEGVGSTFSVLLPVSSNENEHTLDWEFK
jgi:signal transduction histidine kinase